MLREGGGETCPEGDAFAKYVTRTASAEWAEIVDI